MIVRAKSKLGNELSAVIRGDYATLMLLIFVVGAISFCVVCPVCCGGGGASAFGGAGTVAGVTGKAGAAAVAAAASQFACHPKSDVKLGFVGKGVYIGASSDGQWLFIFRKDKVIYEAKSNAKK